ncbi:hypothetical protein [Pseudocnuella soli]|uniref:hypothetical protein n=1 Tax=Pseudocnuella soli TaxID=2502779 RepID=UPI00104876CE|nr:hypothetical protein [Pseudocnuella soli]
MNKYLPVIRKINEHLSAFNEFLKPEFAFSLLDELRINDQSYFLNPTGVAWDDSGRFPGDIFGGVYFYMGVSETSESEISVYIGKASLSSTIGKRLYSHFRNIWQKDKTVISYGGGKACKVELIGAIPFENTDMHFLAPALEEYLIQKLSQDCLLINTHGNN